MRLRLLSALALALVASGCGAGPACAPARASASSCVAVQGYSLDSNTHFSVAGGPALPGIWPQNRALGWAPDVQQGGREMLLATAGYGGLFDLQAVTLTKAPRGAAANVLRANARVSGCLLPHGGLRLTRVAAIPQQGYRATTPVRLRDLANGTELVSPEPVAPGGTLLVLVREGS